MSCDPPPRSVDEGLDWFLSHNASGSGMCAQHTWHSLGGDRGCPPAWGCSDANEVYDKVKKSGRYWTTPKRGDIALWKYGSNGHAARVYDDAGTLIATTNPTGESGGGTGIEPIGYPSKWGATSSARIFTDTYNGIQCFESGEPSIEHGEVFLSKLKYGQEDSDSVKRLQMHLNAHPLDGGENLPVTGNYFDETDEEVRLCQKQHGLGSDTAGKSSVGPQQAAHLFTGCDCTVIDDVSVPEPPDPPDPEEPVDPPVEHTGGAWDDYSGKPSGTLSITAAAGYVKLDARAKAAPVDGLEFHMIYANLDLSWSGSSMGTIRIKYVRDGGDATGYQDYHVKNGSSDFLITATHWEAGEAGVGGDWYINVGGGITKAVGTTRYAKAGGVGY